MEEKRAQDQDQATLVQRAQSGDTVAFAELIQQAQSHVLVVTRAVLGNGHEAEDAAQEAFLRAVADKTAEPEVSAQQALAALECAEMILASAAKHTWD